MQASVVVFLLAWSVLATSNEESDEDVHFTNSWAVHIDNDDTEEVSDIAKKHGFVNQGQIGSLPGYYHFVKHSVKERSRRSLEEHIETLLTEPRVKWVEQQRILERSKRDVIPGEDELVQKSIERLRQDTAVTIRDPFYKDQWYLQNVGQSFGPSGIDINVLPVWAQGYSGKGVVVSVLDDGVDHTHPDLKNNYDPDASFDFNDFDGDPKPRDENLENCHGTKCAGEVAAQADNGICGVGVSFNASIGGIRMLDGKATDTLEGSSLSYRSDYIDIYSCCWGPKDDGKRFGKPGYLASKALQIGAERGRGGKGNIYVWATGNGGLTDDDCNCDGYTTSIHTISIGAISDHGLSTYYTENCASTLAVTFSGGSHRETTENKVVTTDLHHKCTEVFKGTSSAAPLAAGMLALVLEANPKLTWRDVQHVIVETSQITSQLDEGWKINGAGKRYNRKFGFGRLDVSKMVNKALKWKNVDKQRICHGAAHTVSRYIPASGSLILSANTSACSSTASEIRKLEHVQLNITLQHRHRGDLSITLISPSGTRSKLLATRRNDHSARGLKNWLFMTVHCWGEDPRGLWTLIVTDNDNNNRKHHLKELTKGDEEDVTRIFLDNTEKNQQTVHQQDHIFKTMEDTAGRLFNGDGFAKILHRKKPSFTNRKAQVTDTTKTRKERHHDGRKKRGKKHHLNTETNGKTKARKGKQISKGLKRKFIHTAAHAIKAGHRNKKLSSKSYTSSKKVTSKTSFKRKHEKPKASLKNEKSDGKTILRHREPTERRLNRTSTAVPGQVKTLNKSSVSMLRKINASDNATAVDLIKKLISEIEKNPLVTKIALEALKNPAIGKILGIDFSTEVTESNRQKNVSLEKTVGQEINISTNRSSTQNSSLQSSNVIIERKEDLDTKAADANHRSNGTEPLKLPVRVNGSNYGHIQFFKILKDSPEDTHKTDASGSGIEDSKNYLDSGSGENVDLNGSQNLEEFEMLNFQSLRCAWSKNCSDTREEETSVSRSHQRTTKISTEFEGEGDSFEESDEDSKEGLSGDGDGDDFFEAVKENVERDEDSNDLLPDFGIDIKSIIKEKTRPCRNFNQNNSFISSRVLCPENIKNAYEREKGDNILAHYLAVDKLKSAAEDDVANISERHEESSSSFNPDGDDGLKSDQDSSDSKYNGKDLEVLQEALEDQLGRLSKDPNSKKSNAEILARVRDDINRGDIDDLELLESQITDGKTDLSRVVRSISPEEEQMDDPDNYVDTAVETLYGDFKEDEEELEPRGISHQTSKRKLSQAYYVEPDKYGKDNSGILESWTLILYGTK